MAVLAAIGVSHGARADGSVALANGNTLTTANGLTYAITGCIYTLSGTVQTSCGTDNADLETSGTGRSAIMEVESATPGGSVLSLAGSGRQTFSDLSFILTLTSATPGIALTSFTDTLAGTGGAAAAGEVSAGVSSSSTSPNISLTTNLSNLSDTANFTAFNTATAPITLSVDLKVTTIPGNDGGITLTSVTYRAPEPASIALFGTALIGLAAVRRRLQRPARQSKAKA
ncbi:MAG TPA: PEP-CTERM sorting domain-containing protein [Rhodopila sp.]